MPQNERIARIDAKFRHPSFDLAKQFFGLVDSDEMIIFVSEVNARLPRKDVEQD